MKVSKGDSIICFHQNGRPSTITFPDLEPFGDRYNITLIFDQNGNQVYKSGSGYRHGGSSLYLKYHSNGAVSSARHTFQPDGGIQYYDVTTFFNENGAYLREEDHSLNVHNPLLENPVRIENKQTEQTKVKIDSVSLFLKNTTGKKMEILVIRKGQNQKAVYKLKRKDVFIGNYLPVKANHDPFTYFEVIVLPNKKNKDFKLFWNKDFLNGNSNKLIVLDNSLKEK